MAKKNSSKTATEKAIQSSEPRVTTYRGWKGVNYVDSPLTWEPLETDTGKFRQTDLPANFLMVQNNLITTPTLGLETRDDSEVIGKLPDNEIEANHYFTGVSATYYNYIFAVVHIPTDNGFVERIYYRQLTILSFIDVWDWCELIDADTGDQSEAENYVIEEIGFYENNLVATAKNDTQGKVFLAETNVDFTQSQPYVNIKGIDWSTMESNLSNRVVSTPLITDPNTNADDLADRDWPFISAVGMDYSYINDPDDHPNATIRLDIVYCYTNRMGSTLVSYPATIYVEYSPALWSSNRYLKINSRAHSSVYNKIYDTEDKWGHAHPQSAEPDINVKPSSGIQGIDIYAREMENTDYVFIGHIDIAYDEYSEQFGTYWQYNWLGNMTDTTQWLNSQEIIPSENTSQGPNVSHFTSHDSRIYYWGQPDKPYRLYIGGNPGAEFSVARGLGGAWVDIEPGSGYRIAGTAKWKTVSGANIVTILCGHPNTNKVKRFNLVEANLTLTNEISYKSYMYEEVSNVVGCNSRWGYGVFDDGLYCLSRYGLMLTTMAMEYNSQMRNQEVSEAIKPIFTERIGNRLTNGRMVCIDGVIYIALAEDTSYDFSFDNPINLDNVILCYDMGLQAWYTFTHDQVYGHGKGEDPDKIHHILAIDSDSYTEGLGAITDTQIRLYPTTGIQAPTVPEFQVIVETGELIPKMPMQVFDYIEQLEFRFDYFIGDPDDPATILIEGVDYYGRSFTIEKNMNIKSRGNHGLTGEQRNYIEWVRVGKLVESLRIRIKGKARFRLTHIVNKMYTQSDRIGTPYGFDARDSYKDRHGGDTKIHHYINDYNNLRRAVVS